MGFGECIVRMCGLTIASSIVLSLAGACMASDIPAKPDNILVGIEYFAGWWEDYPNKWYGPSDDGSGEWSDWRDRYPERVPLLGEYNDQETTDKEIRTAAEYGVDFFSILWYYNGPEGEKEPNSGYLSRGLANFMASKEASRMKFYIEAVNHPPYEILTEDDWTACIKVWVEAMRHPSYLRIGGRPVLKIHGATYFLQQNGGDLKKAKSRIAQIKKAIQAAGLPEPLIGGGVMAIDPIQTGHAWTRFFDFTATYMDMPQLKQREEDYPYTKLSDYADAARKSHRSDALPYIPYVPSGWAPKPWGDARSSFTAPTKDEWVSELQKVKEDFSKYPKFGFPMPDGSRQKAFTIYAWNEFGEGGFVAPTKGDGFMKLDGVRQVFGGPDAGDLGR